MAKDVITRFKLETTAFDSAIKKASKELSDYSKTATQAKEGFDQFTKANVDAAKALGAMATSSNNAKQKTLELVGAYNDAAKAYENLSDEQKKSDWAKALAGSLTQLQERIKDAKQELYGLGDAADDTGSKFSNKLGGALQVFAGNMMTKAAEAIHDTVSQSIEMARAAEGIEIAFDRLNKPGLLDNLKEATHGTVSELELMKAAVKFNDFKLPVEELGTMLAFAQQKAKDTGQSVDYMVDSIVTGLGRKSLMILDNLGLSAAEIKDKMSETGDMTKAVGAIIREQMSKAGDYVETAADRAAQAAADQQNAMRELGHSLMPIANGVATVLNTMSIAVSKSIGFVAEYKNAFIVAGTAIATYAVVVNRATIATVAHTVATKAATIAQTALNAVQKASPIGLLISGITAAAAAVLLFTDNTKEATDAEKEMARQTEKLKERQQTMSDAIGTATGSVEAKYKSLQTQWLKLKSDSAKIDFINKQRDAFNELGLKVSSVADAQKVLVDMAPDVLKALKSVAEAEAYSDLYKQAIEKRAREWERRVGSVDTGDRFFKYKAGDPLSDAEARAAGVRTNKARTITDELGGMGGHTRVDNLSIEEINKVNEYRRQQAIKLRTELKTGYDEEVDYYEKKWSEAEETALANKNTIAGVWGTTGTLNKGSKGGSSRATAVKAEEILPTGSIAALTKEVQAIQKAQSLVTDTESWRKLEGDIALVRMQIKLLKGEIQPETGSQRMQKYTESVNTSAQDLAASITMNMTSETGKSLADAGTLTKTSWEDAAKAIASAGSALQGLKEPSIKVAAIVGQAVANIALGFSKQSLAAAGGGPLAWIAAIAGGLGTMVSTIAAIKSATKGYSTGGRIEGNSYSGDNLLMPLNSGGYASLNAGEIVLNRAQTNNLANALTPQSTSNYGGAPYLTGELIFLGANNHLGRTGQGEIVTTSMLRSYGLIG